MNKVYQLLEEFDEAAQGAGYYGNLDTYNECREALLKEINSLLEYKAMYENLCK